MPPAPRARPRARAAALLALAAALLPAARRPRAAFLPCPAAPARGAGRPAAPQGEAGGRRSLAQGALLATLGAATGAPRQPALAAPKEDKVTQKDLDRITEGYKGLKYLVANWDKETRDCKGVAGGDAQQSVEGVTAGSGFVDGCAASPLIIRNYLGCSNIFHPLFQSEKLWVRIMNSDYLPADSDDFIDAWEEFEKHKRTGDEWAYTSSWGEANPGGGKDKVEDYLLRSKKEVKLATESLGKLIKMLKLA